MERNVGKVENGREAYHKYEISDKTGMTRRFGEKNKEFQMIDITKNGPYTEFTKEGIVRLKSNKCQGSFHGETFQYYPNGSLQIKCIFNKGSLIGDYKYWHPNGNLYVDGVIHNESTEEGIFNIYDLYGKLISTQKCIPDMNTYVD